MLFILISTAFPRPVTYVVKKGGEIYWFKSLGYPGLIVSHEGNSTELELVVLITNDDREFRYLIPKSEEFTIILDGWLDLKEVIVGENGA